jgi:hypothetical protein
MASVSSQQGAVSKQSQQKAEDKARLVSVQVSSSMIF